MLALRLAKAKHFAFPRKSHGIKNLLGSPSFSGNFFRRTVEQCSFNGVLESSQSLSLLVNKLLIDGPNFGIGIRASAKLILKFKSLKIWKIFSRWSLALSRSLCSCNLDGDRLRDLDFGSFSLDHQRLDVFSDSVVSRMQCVLSRLGFIFHHLRKKRRLKNPPSKHLVFKEPELDKQELGKLEVGKPGVDKQELGFDFSCQEVMLSPYT
nr:hypothetical protein [Tanacetum cinerariifolium]